MTTVVTRGAASAQALGYASSSAAVNYIEDVFSTYLYTGNNTTLPIVNGIDLSTKGGLVWLKARNAAGYVNRLYDTVRGANTTVLFSDLTNGATAATNQINSFNSNGFTLGSNANTNDSAVNYATWTFREQPKFFDIVTYTGTGSNATISHNLGSEPGCIIVKRTDAVASWYVYHRGLSGIGNKYIVLNSTAAEDTGFFWTPTSTTFNVSSTLGLTANGGTYVAYLFAHNAGGFGLTGTDNVISCGSFTTDGSGNATVSLGYEPQWILTRSTGVDNWRIYDNMRGFDLTDGLQLLPNSSAAEASSFKYTPSATGFSTVAANVVPSQAYIYIAIRRGPMKVPTDATKVFQPVTATTVNSVTGTLEASDMGWFKDRATVANWFVSDRLRGIESYYNPTLYTNATDAEVTPSSGDTVSSQYIGNGKIYFGGAGLTTNQPLGYSFRRAPGFFDEVCYTGNGVNGRTVTHNLAAVPEIMIVKRRSAAGSWATYTSSTGNTKRLSLDTADAADVQSSFWNNTSPTSTVFTVGTFSDVNTNGSTYVAYLFATAAGVSKVGSYTGNGTTQTINCGFGAGGARFVLIKRTDSTGDWYVYDTARGMTVLTDPYLLLNSTAAETATLGSVTTVSTGFALNSAILAAINVNAGTYIFLAIA